MKTETSPLHCLVILACACLPATAQEKTPDPEKPAVDPYALSMIGRASKFLADAKHVKFSADISEDILVEEGAPVLQGSRTLHVRLRRPDRLIVEVQGSTPLRNFYYDGATVKIHDHTVGTYADIVAAPTIDETVDLAHEKYGIAFPVEDLLISKPFGDGAAKAKGGQYLGVDQVQGANCHHVAFQNDNLHWEVWIQDGPDPLVRKAVLRFQEEDGRALTALISNWDLQSTQGDEVFQFVPPPGVLKIEAVPTAEDSE